MAKDFNHPKVVESYDEHIRKLIPGYELIHLQVNALLKTYAPTHANILIVGCGTGHELRYLAKHYPQWSFTAIDPAPNMLEKAQALLATDNLDQNVTFRAMDTSGLKDLKQTFDVALSILVSHFIPETAKTTYFQEIYHALNEKGFCLSYDLTQIENQSQLKTLQNLAELTGLVEKQSQAMVERLQDDFFLISNQHLKKLLLKVGFRSVENFAQVMNYYGVFAVK
ncbi:class I SAM-dependent methyltransferase [Acinetobacter defluvii]|uniref:Class I SAM-dependent methyltransferase n=1 Tax=Acinetobacter defluvii TaxID=1871111 RepID=A0A2S2FD16_9GAMM|nr:class I SAM-dependent methyltransferase [Acinetobacter defluvii]AWL28695.1 class I SAM-dependent methyltransferase [Acinetobacter defluvii]